MRLEMRIWIYEFLKSPRFLENWDKMERHTPLTSN